MTIISNFGSLLISGGSGIVNKPGTINGTNITSLSYSDVYKSTIERVSNIYAPGYYAPYQSDIYSGGIGEMNVYFLGYQSGCKTSIICNGKDICNVYCLTDDACDEIGSFSCDADWDCTLNRIDGLTVSTISTTRPTTTTISSTRTSTSTNNWDQTYNSTIANTPSMTTTFATTTTTTMEPEFQDSNLQLIEDFDRLRGSVVYYRKVICGVADSIGYLTVAKFFLQLGDLITDLVFNVILYSKNTLPILTYISIGSILLSYLGSICICVIWLIRWKV